MGTGSIVDFTSDSARHWWRELSRNVFELGVEGVKADDGEGYYFPPDAELADGRSGVQAAWEYGRLYRETTQQALDDVHGEGRGVVFGRSGWTGQQATGMLWDPRLGAENTDTGTGVIRTWVEPLYVVPLYVLAIVGFVLVAPAVRALAAIFVLYETLAAWVFAGTTRYRVPWDFVLALLAAAALERLWSAFRRRGRPGRA